jgi:hypothetical protein
MAVDPVLGPSASQLHLIPNLLIRMKRTQPCTSPGDAKSVGLKLGPNTAHTRVLDRLHRPKFWDNLSFKTRFRSAGHCLSVPYCTMAPIFGAAIDER